MSSAGDIWDEFWANKDKANTDLIEAASRGWVTKVEELLSPRCPHEEQAEI